MSAQRKDIRQQLDWQVVYRRGGGGGGGGASVVVHHCCMGRNTGRRQLGGCELCSSPDIGIIIIVLPERQLGLNEKGIYICLIVWAGSEASGF